MHVQMCRRAGLVGTVLSLRILVLEDTRSCDAVLLLLLLLHVAWRGVACGVAAYTERRPSDQAVDRSQRSRKIVSKRASVHAD